MPWQVTIAWIKTSDGKLKFLEIIYCSCEAD